MFAKPDLSVPQDPWLPLTCHIQPWFVITPVSGNQPPPALHRLDLLTTWPSPSTPLFHFWPPFFFLNSTASSCLYFVLRYIIVFRCWWIWHQRNIGDGISSFKRQTRIQRVLIYNGIRWHWISHNTTLIFLLATICPSETAVSTRVTLETKTHNEQDVHNDLVFSITKIVLDIPSLAQEIQARSSHYISGCCWTY